MVLDEQSRGRLMRELRRRHKGRRGGGQSLKE